jgi:ketosteroid isomerase-like protein
MDAPVDRAVVEGFYRALASRDPQRIAAYIADDIDWMLIGPREMLAFCGPRRGKAAVVEVFEHLIPAVLDVTVFTPEYLLVDGNSAAGFNRITATQHANGRVLTCRGANFMRFRDGKIYEYRSIIDSIETIEQILGHRLDLSRVPGPDTADVVADDSDVTWQ